MGRYRIVRTKEAEKDLAKILKSGNKSDIKKVEIFFSEIVEHPKTSTGFPEQLKHFDGEVWSRRINKKDRFVYEIYEEDKNAIVINSLGHYNAISLSFDTQLLIISTTFNVKPHHRNKKSLQEIQKFGRLFG